MTFLDKKIDSLLERRMFAATWPAVCAISLIRSRAEEQNNAMQQLQIKFTLSVS